MSEYQTLLDLEPTFVVSVHTRSSFVRDHVSLLSAGHILLIPLSVVQTPATSNPAQLEFHLCAPCLYLFGRTLQVTFYYLFHAPIPAERVLTSTQ